MFSYSLYVVCCLYVTFLLPPERTPKAGPCHLSIFMSFLIILSGILILKKNIFPLSPPHLARLHHPSTSTHPPKPN